MKKVFAIAAVAAMFVACAGNASQSNESKCCKDSVACCADSAKCDSTACKADSTACTADSTACTADSATVAE